MIQGLIGLDRRWKVLHIYYIFSGYWQYHIADEGIPKAAFPMRYSLYKWVITSMGLMNAPATFMQTMNNLFSNILDSSMAVFLDDILVYLYMV